MLAAAGMVGVTGKVGFVYATTDNDNFSENAVSWETRQYTYAPGKTREERLEYYAGGGWNKWEAVAVINDGAPEPRDNYYAVKEAHGPDAVEIMREILRGNELSGNYQCWRYQNVDNQRVCNTDDQYPAPLP